MVSACGYASGDVCSSEWTTKASRTTCRAVLCAKTPGELRSNLVCWQCTLTLCQYNELYLEFQKLFLHNPPRLILYPNLPSYTLGTPTLKLCVVYECCIWAHVYQTCQTIWMLCLYSKDVDHSLWMLYLSTCISDFSLMSSYMNVMFV